MVCASLGSLLRSLRHFLCSILLLIHRVLASILPETKYLQLTSKALLLALVLYI